MTFKTMTAAAFAIAALTACSPQTQSAADTVTDAAKTAAAKVDASTKAAGVDISSLPKGLYHAESGHAYIAFSYDHQGYSKPIIRWGKFGSTVALDPEAPEKSGVGVVIDVASVDTGVPVFDEHLVSANWFDAAQYPEIVFQNTAIDQSALGSGTLTGDLTIKGVTRPVTLDVTLNKVGNHFRSKKPMFGISATGSLKRSDFGIDRFAPMADDINLTIEIEYIKEADGESE